MKDTKIIFDSVDIRGMNICHFNQLLGYTRIVDYSGEYWGNRTNFDKRHEEIRTWILNIIKHAEEDGVVIPKK